MWIVKLRRDGRASRRGSEAWVPAATAARLTAAGRAAVLVGEARTEADEPDELPVSLEFGSSPRRSAGPTCLFLISPAVLAVETPGGRRRLHRFAAQEDFSLNGDQQEMADLLLRLGCAVPALPPPAGRDTLVRLRVATEVAGLQLPAGSAAALDFDPLSVLPELRHLGLYPWEVLDIERLGDTGCQGEALEFIRLVVLLEQPWHPMSTAGFLAGVYVDVTYRDYRRQPPSGQVIRAYATHGDHRPPHAVLGPDGEAREPSRGPAET